MHGETVKKNNTLNFITEKSHKHLRVLMVRYTACWANPSCTINIHATAFEICYFRKCHNWCWSFSPWECYKGIWESAGMGLRVINRGTTWRWPFSFTMQLKQTHPSPMRRIGTRRGKNQTTVHQ